MREREREMSTEKNNRKMTRRKEERKIIAR
jgi:hypothetical protein